MNIIATVIVLFATSAVSVAGAADPITSREDARAMIRAEQWREATDAFEQIVETNPYRGSDWYFLGLAYANLGKCALAEPLFERAIALGVSGYTPGMQRAYVQAAACAADRGAIDDAIKRLSIAQARYEFSDFSSLESDPRFAAIVDTPGYIRLAGRGDWSSVDRVAGWRADLDYFVDLVERRHPNPFHTTDEAQWRRAIENIRNQIPKLNDAQMIGAFMRLAGMIKDGHTSIYPPVDGSFKIQLAPIWPYAFGDEWRIVAAGPEYAELAGARITAVEGLNTKEAVERIASHLPSDNFQTSRWLANVALQIADSGAIIFNSENQSCLSITVETLHGDERVTCINGGAIDRDPQSRWAPEDWASVAHADAPLWLSNLTSTHWFTTLDEMNAVYAQVNQIRNADEQTLEQFARAIVQEIEDKKAHRLILDLRHNNGGNGYLNWPFVREIIRSEKIDRKGGLFVIVGRRTFSAAMLLSSMLEFHTPAIFVGEPTGSRPQFYGEDTFVELPYSKLQGSISSRKFQNRFTSDDQRPWIAPDLIAELTFDDIRSGRDPAIEAIGDYLHEQDNDEAQR